jgi:hypothetical protein
MQAALDCFPCLLRQAPQAARFAGATGVCQPRIATPPTNHKSTMSTRLKPEEVLDQYHLQVRHQLLEIAAVLDRFQRAGGGDPAESVDPRLARCRSAMAVLSEAGASPDRAERVALIFSDQT